MDLRTLNGYWDFLESTRASSSKQAQLSRESTSCCEKVLALGCPWFPKQRPELSSKGLLGRSKDSWKAFLVRPGSQSLRVKSFYEPMTLWQSMSHFVNCPWQLFPSKPPHNCFKPCLNHMKHAANVDRFHGGIARHRRPARAFALYVAVPPSARSPCRINS